MVKFLFAILLILGIYLYASITPSSRGDINHNVALIPQHIGQVWESVTNKVDSLQQDYHAESQN